MEQLIASIHRIRYVSVARTRSVSERRADPGDPFFDPIKAAILHQQAGNAEEAFWLVFLSVHFGKNARAGWRYAAEVYGRLGNGHRWDWAAVSIDPAGFRDWLYAHQDQIRRTGVARGFGNHRKYTSLDARSPHGTGAAVESYVRWINPPRTHVEVVAEALGRAGGNPRLAFRELYKSMSTVETFGRMARFDYLAMLGKLGLADIEPDSAYLTDSTGPLEGARLLFGPTASARHFDSWLLQLDELLGVGMQVLEDALCNWQKSPHQFKPFRL